MSKIEEIKEQIILDGGYTDYEECIDECMRQYAELCEMELLARIRNKMRNHISEELLDMIVNTPLLSSEL